MDTLKSLQDLEQYFDPTPNASFNLESQARGRDLQTASIDYKDSAYAYLQAYHNAQGVGLDQDRLAWELSAAGLLPGVSGRVNAKSPKEVRQAASQAVAGLASSGQLDNVSLQLLQKYGYDTSSFGGPKARVVENPVPKGFDSTPGVDPITGAKVNPRPQSGQTNGLPIPGTPAVPGVPATPATPATPITPQTPVGQTHLVQQGDTLSAIAKKYGVNVSDITGYRSGNPNLIYPGEQLTIAKNMPSTPAGSSIGTGAGSDSTSGSQEPQDFMGQVKSLLAEYGVSAPDSKKSPVNAFTDTYEELFKSLGLNEVKSQMEKLNKEFSDLQNKKNDEIADVNEDPWLSEGVRVMRIQKINDRYETKENTLTNKLELYGALYDSGREDARFVAQQAMTLDNRQQDLDQALIFKAIDIAEKRSEAAAKLAEDSKLNPAEFKEVQGGLYDIRNNKWIVPPKATGGNGNGNGTLTSYNKILAAVRLPITVATDKGELTKTALNKVVSSGVPIEVASGIWSNIIAGNSLEEIRQGLLSQIGNRDTAYGYLDKFMQALQGSGGSTDRSITPN